MCPVSSSYAKEAFAAEVTVRLKAFTGNVEFRGDAYPTHPLQVQNAVEIFFHCLICVIDVL